MSTAVPDGEHVLVAGGARACVTAAGAALRTFTVDGVPYTESWPAGQDPPLGAGGVLVPWPNRVAGATWTWRDRTHRLAVTEPDRGHAIHGLLRGARWRLVERTDGPEASAVTLAAEVEAGDGWPQPLAVTVTYRVGPDGLAVTHTVTDTGDGEVPVGLGVHPYLRAGHAAPDDCVLTLAASTVLDVDSHLIPTGPPRPVSADQDFRGGVSLAGVDLDTTFGGATPAPGSTVVSHELRAPDGTGVRLWADPAFGWVQVFTPGGFPRPGSEGSRGSGDGAGRAVAVEPMTCPPDALNSHTDLTVLAPGRTWTVRWGLAPFGPSAAGRIS